MEDKKAKAQSAKKIEDVVTAGQESVEIAVKAGQETIEKAAKAGKENAEKAAKAAKAGTDALSNGYDRYLALTREQLEKVLPEAFGKFDVFTNYGKGTADAFLKAGDVAAKAFETIGDDVAAYQRRVWDDSITNTKALFGCKTFEEVIELQTTVARTQFDKFVSDSTKLGELSLKTVNQVLEPIGV